MNVLSLSGIAVSVRDSNGEQRYVLKKWQRFDLECPGIYTIEGANQVGKSVLIKLVMGALPRGVQRGKVDHTIIDDKKVVIRHVADALKHGLVAVFQDDDLIPSMTIGEQLAMRHATPRGRDYLNQFLRWAFDQARLDWLRKKTGRRVSWLERLVPSEYASFPAVRVRADALGLLEKYGTDARGLKYTRILDMFPRQMSHGAKAVARLVAAQLTPNIRVLFLDESLSGVQSDVWPRLVEVLRNWTQEGNRCLVAVSHNQAELIQWQPRQRFVINDGALEEKGIQGYKSLQPGLPRKLDAFPVFEPPYTSRWCDSYQGPVAIIIDQEVRDHVSLHRIVAHLDAEGVRPVHFLEVQAAESSKSWDTATGLVDRVLQVLPNPYGMILVVGGGVTLNLGGFVAATVFRGRLPYIVVPTTVMAMADVAVGSKTGVNFRSSLPGAPPLKNAVGVYENPTAVIVDSEFIQTLPIVERKRGLSEVLKHGLLQSEGLFGEAMRLLRDPSPADASCSDLARRTVQLKRALLSYDPWENGPGRILLYGHLHAHAVERASDFRICHGDAVFLGILVELRLAGSEKIYREVLDTVRSQSLVDATELRRIRARITDVYLDPYLGARSLWAIEVNRVGEYGVTPTDVLRVRDCAWSDGLRALDAVLADL